MLVNVLSNPVNFYTDTNGQPLQSGSVFIGQPNTDPTNPANQITVYQDNGLSIPLQQPLRTINGQPALNGTHIPVYLGIGVTSYSLAVENSFGVVVMSLPSVTPFSLGGTVGTGTLIFKEYVAGVDFTAGTAPTLTLPSAPGSATNAFIDVDGVMQKPNIDYAVNGQTLTFLSPVPNGTQTINARIGQTVSVGVPGTGTVGDVQLAWGNILNRVCDSIAALAALNITVYTRAFVTGYYAAGDGGGGSYYYSASTSQASANGGTIIAAAGGVGCWLLEQTGPVSIKQFGAKGDGTTDDTNAIVACCNAVLDVFVPQGLYQHTDITITGRNSLTIRGVGGFYNAQFRGTVSGFGFSFVSCTNLELRDLTFTAANGVTGVGGVQIDTNSNIQVYKCLFYTFTGPGLQHNGTSGAPISGCVLKDSFFLSCGTDGTSPQFYATYSNDFMYTDNQFGSIQPFSLANRPAIGVHFSNCSNGFYGDNLIWECGQGMVIDNVGGTACLYNRIIGNRFEQCQQQGFYSIGSVEMIFTNNWINNNSLAASGTYANALFDSTINSIITNNQSYDWGGGGGHTVQYCFAFQNNSTNNVIGNNKCAFWNIAPYGVTSNSTANAWDSPSSFTSITAIAAGQTLYLGPNGLSAGNVSPQIATGKKQALYIDLRLSVAPGVGQTLQGTLYVNGASTAQNVVISGTSTAGVAIIPVTLNDGDEFAVQLVSSGGAASTVPRCRISMANI